MSYLGAKHKPEKPLGDDGGRYPDAMLPLWSYKSELLTTKSEAYQHLLQKVTILSKAINRNKPSLADDVAVLPEVGYHTVDKEG